MKISTLNSPIIHERKPEHDEERFAALEAAFDQLIAETEEELMCAYIYSNLSVLKYIAPVIDIVIADSVILIIEEMRVIPVDRAGLSRQEITKAMICAVKKGVS